MKRLIEDELPLAPINRASDTDKRTHDGHISTLHVWWAAAPTSDVEKHGLWVSVG